MDIQNGCKEDLVFTYLSPFGISLILHNSVLIVSNLSASTLWIIY